MEELILQWIALYGQREVMREVALSRSQEPVCLFLRASLTAEVIKKCDWVMSPNGTFTHIKDLK